MHPPIFPNDTAWNEYLEHAEARRQARADNNNRIAESYRAALPALSGGMWAAPSPVEPSAVSGTLQGPVGGRQADGLNEEDLGPSGEERPMNPNDVLDYLPDDISAAQERRITRRLINEFYDDGLDYGPI